ncbi:MAG: adenylosuccinate synthase [Bacteroidales bacterium]|jgi:adenylosuccinate synthase|nr:adenylosuccinate synthase [Bacteroidales bacterium]
MKVDVLLGLQWGDEGKGKIVDVLTPKYDIVARFQGGPNAGHTLEFNGQKFTLHTLPSGIFRENTINVIGNGVIIDPAILIYKEVESVKDFCNIKDILLVSQKAHLITPTHKLLDYIYETCKGDKKIGSTLKGIGPTYTDKISRDGLRVGDILNPNFKQKYETLKKKHLRIANAYDVDYSDVKLDGFTLEEYENRWFLAVEELKTYNIINTEYYLNEALNSKKSILAEGAQGTLLDIDFGTYPYVTSSNTIAAGVCTGLGIAPTKIGRVFGIFKSYITRVGSGPFTTELHDEVGDMLRVEGNEFGSTTGRPRRCGWMDIPLLKYACMLNGVTDLIMMKADVLNKFETISVCNKYNINGVETDEIPFDNEMEIEPKYLEIKGWNQEIKDKNLPVELSNYIKLIEESVNIPITILSFGPDREQTLIFDNFK